MRADDRHPSEPQSEISGRQNWFHYIFNPGDNSPGPAPQRFLESCALSIQRRRADFLDSHHLAQPQDPQLFKTPINSISAWQKHPFQPWVIASSAPPRTCLQNRDGLSR